MRTWDIVFVSIVGFIFAIAGVGCSAAKPKKKKPPNEMTLALVKHKHALFACYERYTTSEERHSTRMFMGYADVDADGKVTNAYVDHSNLPVDAGNCILDVIRTIRFKSTSDAKKQILVTFPQGLKMGGFADDDDDDIVYTDDRD